MAKINKRLAVEIGTITVGAVIIAFAIHVLYNANHLVIGGVTGLAIIIEAFTKNTAFPIPVWLTNIFLNIPLFLLAVKAFGIKNIGKTVYATAALTAALYFMSPLPTFVTDDLFLVSIFGGVAEGIGLGFIFRCMATTGGTDTAAALINKMALPHISLQKIMFAIDSVIIALGIVVFGLEKGMYAIISVFVLVKVVDYIQEGLSFAKAVFIISEKQDEIAEAVINDVSRGVTGLFGKGMYTKQDKNVLLCVVSTKQIIHVKRLVKNIDEKAFLFVADVREVMGEGFKDVS